MSRLGKTLLLVAGFSVLVLTIVRTVLGGWHNLLFIPLILFLLSLVVGIIKDIRFYKEFLTMKTTKHGMNMGLLILLTIVFLIAVNFMAIRHNQKWDWTSEGLNTLSEQSIKIAKKIDQGSDDLEIKFFYRGGVKGVEQAKIKFKETVTFFSDQSNKIKLQFIDLIKNPGMAKKYRIEKPVAQVFVDYKDRRNTIDSLDEEGIATALFKVTREQSKKIYFTTGHGESSLSGRGPETIFQLKVLLESSGFNIDTVSLIDKTSVPKDADLLVIISPKNALLKRELDIIRRYVREGGSLLVAADPGDNHNVALLSKSFGIDYKNDYVLDQVGQAIGGSAAMALGRNYGTTIASKFRPNTMTLFHLASSVVRSDDALPSLKIERIVATTETSFTTDSITHGEVAVNPERKGPHNIGMLVEGKVEGDNKSRSKDFSVAVFGDSDFLSNQFLSQQQNKNLGVNLFSYLLEEKDLISIRPKKPKGTTLMLTEMQFWIYMFSVILLIPILLFGAGGFVWYKRRSA